ncbi:MAG: hypothetical protein KY476_07325 [Planctomycetes bacterium]|nr:hypothetical protein [Planctomycetota bacterium]
MRYEDLVILIPSHSLEDFPTELDDEQTASLLNAFAVLWHPALLASAGALPSWHRSDEPPALVENRLVIVPLPASSWVPGGWIERARSDGATVIAGEHERAKMLDAALEPLDETPPVDPELAGDFLALGMCWLQLELLTRHMHHFSNLDEVYLQREAVAAARAALADDAEAARAHLRSCFEVLLEARERFYPVDCFLIDLCLLIPDLADEHLVKTLARHTPLNLIATAEDLAAISRDKPERLAEIKAAWDTGALEVCGGDLREAPLPMLPVESLLWEFFAGRRVFRELVGRCPTTWGRRRFGLSTLLPQVLKRFGYHSALHLVMDDGLYPDAEESKIRWEGCDGTVLDAISRIPLPAEGSASFLRFSVRMAESMEQNHVAAVLFARWPEVRSPFFDDFRRMHAYAPVLGRFVTLDDFFRHSDNPGRLSRYEAREYLTPFFIQAVARREAEPIGRWADHLRRRAVLNAGLWCRAAAEVISAQALSLDESERVERLVELAGAGSEQEAIQQAGAALEEFVPAAARGLSDLVLHSAGDRRGVLVINPLSFARTATVELPMLLSPPAVGGAVKSSQFDDRHQAVTLELPGCGYVWLPAEGAERLAGRDAEASGPALVEDLILRNEFFEVYINDQTGGVARIKNYGRSPNRLSQQLAYRFGRERTIRVGEDEHVKSYYSEMRASRTEVTSTGPAVGEVVTWGEIIDQEEDRRLAGFRQTTRVWRARPIVEIEIELEPETLPEGDPWTNYYAARFAWNDSTASLTRSVHDQAQGFSGERFDGPQYLEIASDSERTTILPCGRPYWRKTGPRMVDSLMIVEGETRRRFRFAIAVDCPYPLEPALEELSPPLIVPTEAGPPSAGTSGWFFHLSARNVQLTRILPLVEPAAHAPLDQLEQAARPAAEGFAVRLLETEGRDRQVRLRCFRTPHSARRRDFNGETISELRIEGDAVLVDMTKYEIADVELRFA